MNRKHSTSQCQIMRVQLLKIIKRIESDNNFYSNDILCNGYDFLNSEYDHNLQNSLLLALAKRGLGISVPWLDKYEKEFNRKL